MFFNYKDLTTQQMINIIDDIKTQEKHHNDQLANLDNEQLNYQTFFQKSIDLDAENVYKSTILEMDSFHPSKEIRDKTTDLSTAYQKFSIDQSMRKDVYSKFKYYYDNVFPEEKAKFILSPEQIRYVEKCKLGYEMSGLSLPDDKYKQFKTIKQQLSENSNNFSKNLAEENSKFKYPKDRLSSMPEYWLKNKTVDDDSMITLTLKYPDYVPLMEYCADREIRKDIAFYYGTRCNESNTPLIKQNLALRKELASLYDMNYVDFKLQDRMAKKLSNVSGFLNSIKQKINPVLSTDLKALEELAGHKMEPYDISYYSRIYKEQELDLKMDDLKQLFSTSTVIDGTMKIYQQLLNLEFEDITPSVKHTLWHDEVNVYSVKDSGSTIGHFYLDLYPREGKYGHAAVFPFVRRSVTTDTTILPLAVMACNFDTSGTLTFNEVETFFHEFGHVMHNMCTKATISSFAGTSVERDFVETPSQFFENWCYYYESLKYLAPTIDTLTCTKLQKMKNLLNGYHYSRQLVFAISDIALHTKYDGSVELNKFYRDIHNDIMGYYPMEGTNMLASFGHIMDGYDSGYYGYLWSEVYSVLLLEQFTSKQDMMDTELGNKLKETILAPGGTQESSLSMEQFLDRPLNFETDINIFIKAITMC